MNKVENKCGSKAAGRRREMQKSRNWLAVRAFQRSGAGRHPDRKKVKNKRACRGAHKTAERW